MPLRKDPERQECFIESIRATGSIIESARRASPASEKGAVSTFRGFMRDSPEFAARVQEALDDFRDSLVREAVRRGRDGVDRPIYQKGQLVGHERVFSDHLLTLELKKHHEGYRERTQHDHRVTIQPSGAWQIGTDDLAALNQEQRDQLRGIMTTIREHRGELQAIERQQIEHQRESQVIDADFTESDQPEEWELAYEGNGDD